MLVLTVKLGRVIADSDAAQNDAHILYTILTLLLFFPFPSPLPSCHFTPFNIVLYCYSTLDAYALQELPMTYLLAEMEMRGAPFDHSVLASHRYVWQTRGYSTVLYAMIHILYHRSFESSLAPVLPCSHSFYPFLSPSLVLLPSLFRCCRRNVAGHIATLEAQAHKMARRNFLLTSPEQVGRVLYHATSTERTTVLRITLLILYSTVTDMLHNCNAVCYALLHLA